MTWRSAWLDFVPDRDSPATDIPSSDKADRTPFVSSVRRAAGLPIACDPPLDRPIDPGIAEWLAAQPEDSRREWWRSVARNHCVSHNWREAEWAATRILEECRPGGGSESGA